MVSGDLATRTLAQLEEWGLAETALGESAMDLAKRLDEPGVRPAAAAMLHAQFRPVLLELMKLAPEPEANDKIDELTRKRNERRGA